MRRTWILAGLLSIVPACEKNQPTPEPSVDAAAATSKGVADAGAPDVSADAEPDAGLSDRIEYMEGPKPDDDTPIATWNDFTVTIGDFEKASQLGRLFAPEAEVGKPFPKVPAERMAMPTVHFTTTRALISREVVARAIEKYNIKISEEDAVNALEGDPTLARWAGALGTPELKTQLATIGLNEDDVKKLGWEIAARKKLEDHLVKEISEDEVWERYKFENTTVRLLVASAPNLPGTKDLSTFIEENDEAIEKYYEEHKRDFRVPNRARVDLVRPKPGSEVDRATLEKAAKLLESTPASEVAKELGLEALEGQFMVRAENARAFSAKLNDTGFSESGPRGPHAWKLRGMYPSHFPELNKGLRRQVAAEMMRRQHLVPSVKADLEKARKVLAKVKAKSPDDNSVAKAGKAILSMGLDYKVTEPFPKLPNGSVPGFGLAEEVAAEAFELSPRRRTSKPLLSRERGFVIHLLSQTKPDRQDFEDQKELLLDSYRQDARATIVDRYVQATANPDDLQIDLKPIARKYGIYRK